MIWTSNFQNVKRIMAEKPHMVFCSISGRTPEWFTYEQNCIKYPKLAPKLDWWKDWHEMFKDNLESDESRAFYVKRYYETVLNTLDPAEVKNELLELSERNDVCLLCYEEHPAFCHRQLVSQWFKNNGIDCREIAFRLTDEELDAKIEEYCRNKWCIADEAMLNRIAEKLAKMKKEV